MNIYGALSLPMTAKISQARHTTRYFQNKNKDNILFMIKLATFTVTSGFFKLFCYFSLIYFKRFFTELTKNIH